MMFSITSSVSAKTMFLCSGVPPKSALLETKKGVPCKKVRPFGKAGKNLTVVFLWSKAKRLVSAGIRWKMVQKNKTEKVRKTQKSNR